MSGLTDKIRDTLTNRMQRAQKSSWLPGAASRTVARAQRVLQRNPRLEKLVSATQRHVPPLRRRRSGSGKSIPMGTGKAPIGMVQPGPTSSMKPSAPGAIIFGDAPVPINLGCEITTVKVVNTGDRPISVGSHFHFAEANPALEFDRKAAWGKRQNIISSGMSRFDPGVTQEIELIPFGGRRIAAGFRGECKGPLDA